MPIVFIAFNRPRETDRVVAAIRQLRPAVLLTVCDGPRTGHPTDDERCATVRSILSQVDWPCEVHRNWADDNMGCGARISTGLTWAFSLVDRAIVLEDDCVPHPSFFPYCAELLHRYEADERVMAVTGHNHLGRYDAESSYVFSGYAALWGWATWRRAWARYDRAMTTWPRTRCSDAMTRWFPDAPIRDKVRSEFDGAHSGRIDCWGYQWQYTCLSRGGLVATPTRNLISNVGDTGAHTSGCGIHHHRDVYGVDPWPIVHPRAVRLDRPFDRQLYRAWYADLWQAYVQRLRCELWAAHERRDYRAALRWFINASRADADWLHEVGKWRLLARILKRGALSAIGSGR